MNRPLNVRIILFLSLIFSSISIVAQDIHFSQIHKVQQLLNPATTGVMEPRLRFSDSYRSQWGQIDLPFVTNYLALEGKAKLLGRNLGIGGFMLHDQSSSIYLTADQFYLSVNHSFYYKNNQFVVGIQPGWILKSYNADLLTFDSQFDQGSEGFNPALPSGEDMLEDNMNYFDLNAGVFWRSKLGLLFPTFGFGAQHINRPIESFYIRNDSTPLATKFTFHGSIKIPFRDRWLLDPQFIFMTKGGSNLLLTGIKAGWSPGIEKLAVENVYGLLHFRMSPFENVDAFILGAGIHFYTWDLCVSYDFTTSALRKASQFQRAFEISLTYLFQKPKTDSNPEPCFML